MVEDDSLGAKISGASRIPMEDGELALSQIPEQTQLTLPWHKSASTQPGRGVGPDDAEVALNLNGEIWSRLCVDGGSEGRNREAVRVFHFEQFLGFVRP